MEIDAKSGKSSEVARLVSTAVLRESLVPRVAKAKSS